MARIKTTASAYRFDSVQILPMLSLHLEFFKAQVSLTVSITWLQWDAYASADLVWEKDSVEEWNYRVTSRKEADHE